MLAAMVEPTGASMTKLGPQEKLYPVIKIAMIVDALRGEGVSSALVVASQT